MHTERRYPVTKKEEGGKKLLPFLAFLLLLLLFAVTAASSQNTDRKLIDLKIKGKNIKVEVVRTDQEKAKGLMFRENLEKDEGMIFVYGREEYLSFWMKNTRIPLSIAFLDKTGKIVDIRI